MKIRRRASGLYVPEGAKGAEGGLSLPEGFTGLMIAVPAYRSTLHTACAKSICLATVKMALLGVPTDICYLVSESMVTRARDQILAVFMGLPQFSHVLMVDSDVEFPGEVPLRLLADACFHEIVMCAYPRKKQPIGFPLVWTPEQLAAGLNIDQRTGCVELEAGPAGCLMVSRTAVKKLMDAHPELKYTADQPYDEHRYALFNPFMEGDKLWSEDITFCKRWRALGGSIWLNPYFDLTLWSGSVPFKGHLLDVFETEEKKKEAAG